MNLCVTCNGHQYTVCDWNEVKNIPAEMVRRIRLTLYQNNHRQTADHVERLVHAFIRLQYEYTDLTTCEDDYIELFLAKAQFVPPTTGKNVIFTCNGHSYIVGHESEYCDSIGNLCGKVMSIVLDNKHKITTLGVNALVEKFGKNKGEYTKWVQQDGNWCELYLLPADAPAPLELTQSDAQIAATFEGINIQLGHVVGALLKQAFYEGYQMARDLNTFDETKFCWPVQQEAWVNSEAFEIAEKHGYEDRKA